MCVCVCLWHRNDAALTFRFGALGNGRKGGTIHWQVGRTVGRRQITVSKQPRVIGLLCPSFLSSLESSFLFLVSLASRGVRLVLLCHKVETKRERKTQEEKTMNYRFVRVSVC